MRTERADRIELPAREARYRCLECFDLLQAASANDATFRSMKAANIRSVAELKNRTKALLREVTDSKQSIVITQNGKPGVVLMDAAEHDRLQDTLAMLKILAQSEDSLARSKVSSSAEVRRRSKLVLEKASRR